MISIVLTIPIALMLSLTSNAMAEAVIVAKVEGFQAYEDTAKAKLRLVDAERGKKPNFRKAKRSLQLLVLSDQRMDGPG